MEVCEEEVRRGIAGVGVSLSRLKAVGSWWTCSVQVVFGLYLDGGTL
jgi:hypothetical protein